MDSDELAGIDFIEDVSVFGDVKQDEGVTP